MSQPAPPPNVTAAPEKPPREDTWPIFARLLRMLRPYYGTISVGIVCLLLSTPCELFPAFTWKFVTDDIILGKDTMPWMRKWFSLNGAIQSPYALVFSAAGWMFLVYLVGEFFGTLETNLLNRVAQKFIHGFRNTVYAKLQSQSLGYLQRQRTGDLMSRAMGDVDELQSFIVGSIDVILSEGLLWVLTVIIVMRMDWVVASCALAPLFLVYFMLRYFNARVAPIYKAARERLGDVSTRLQENLSGVVVIKIFAREKQEAARFRQATDEYYAHQIDAINARSLFFPFSRTVGFLSNVNMVMVGGYRMLTGHFTVGEFVMFRAYWWRLFGPVQTLARVNDMIQRSAAAGRRVFELLDAPDDLPDAPDARPVTNVTGALALSNVTFAYPADLAEKKGTGVISPPPDAAPAGSVSAPADPSSIRHSALDIRHSPPVLRHITLTIPPGQTVALCGPSGSGKSTILNLLLRFYDPTEGSVTLDTTDLRSITRDSLRTHFALVQQETFLFNDTILDNIRYGQHEATMDQVIAAAQSANAHNFISKLPQGYNTKVGERGVRLSGGQKQRISIARAFLANPRILLLDEPTSSVEPDSEAAIVAALDRLMKNRTTVLTSHRPSLILASDYIYVIEDGRITQQGPPDHLRTQPGWFQKFLRTTDPTPSPDLEVTD